MSAGGAGGGAYFAVHSAAASDLGVGRVNRARRVGRDDAARRGWSATTVRARGAMTAGRGYFVLRVEAGAAAGTGREIGVTIAALVRFARSSSVISMIACRPVAPMSLRASTR
jgi:hypothetical protein